MKEIPSICILLTLAPNSTDLVSLPHDDGAKVMPVDTHNTVRYFLACK